MTSRNVLRSSRKCSEEPRNAKPTFQAMIAALEHQNPKSDSVCGERKRRGRILYADGDTATSSLSRLWLERAGFDVIYVENGHDAWNSLETGSVDLLVAECQMPVLTGLELASRLRQNGSGLPIILTSRSLMRLAQSDDLKCDVAATLIKPFHPEDLVLAAIQALRRRPVSRCN